MLLKKKIKRKGGKTPAQRSCISFGQGAAQLPPPRPSSSHSPSQPSKRAPFSLPLTAGPHPFFHRQPGPTRQLSLSPSLPSSPAWPNRIRLQPTPKLARFPCQIGYPSPFLALANPLRLSFPSLRALGRLRCSLTPLDLHRGVSPPPPWNSWFVAVETRPRPCRALR